MSIRLDGRDLVPMAADVGAAVANPTPRLAVFVHGLCETDRSWIRSSSDPASPAASATYGERLRSDLGYTPLLVRYNTGLHVSENGRARGAAPREDRRGVAAGGAGGGLRRSLDGRGWSPAAPVTTETSTVRPGRHGSATSSASVRRTSAHRSRRRRTWPAGRSLAGRNRFRSAVPHCAERRGQRPALRSRHRRRLARPRS